MPPFKWAPLFTAEKFNERPDLNDPPPPLLSPLLSNERPFWKVENQISDPALIQLITVIIISGDDLITWDGLFQSYYHKTKE